MFPHSKTSVGLAWLLSVGLWPGMTSAQLLGAMATAAVEEVGAQKVGGYVGITDDFISLTGQVRYGVASSFDLGAKVSFVDFESPVGSSLGLNADGRVQILDVFLQDPLDLAVGPEVTYFRAGGVTNWFFGGYVALSKEFLLENGKALTPYGRVGVRLRRVETDLADRDDVDAGVSAGLEYAIAGYTTVWGEMMFEDAGTGVHIGFQYELR